MDEKILEARTGFNRIVDFVTGEAVGQEMHVVELRIFRDLSGSFGTWPGLIGALSYDRWNGVCRRHFGSERRLSHALPPRFDEAVSVRVRTDRHKPGVLFEQRRQRSLSARRSA